MDYKLLANRARIKVLTMIHRAQTSHIASNFSVIDIATVLYENLKEGDEVVWSAGWKAATIYYFLANQGKIPWEDLDKFGKEIDGQVPYLGLAETNVPGVHVSGGSMGHGLPVAVGMALAKKRAGEKGMIYCIMSDGELNEGTTWESVLLANHHDLDNLIIIIDKNGWQAMGKTEDVLKVNGLPTRGFIIDGHNYEQLEKWLFPHLFEGVDTRKGPWTITCETVKGKGVSMFEDKLLYHYKNIDKETYEQALKELGVEGKSDVDVITSATQYNA